MANRSEMKHRRRFRRGRRKAGFRQPGSATGKQAKAPVLPNPAQTAAIPSTLVIKKRKAVVDNEDITLPQEVEVAKTKNPLKKWLNILKKR